MTINPFENSPLSDRFDTTATPAFFSTFPVRRSKYHHALSEILSHTIDNSPLCDGLKRQWETHFDTPLGSDLYSVTWCESPELERLVLWMNALEVSFIYDAYTSLFQSTNDSISLLSSTTSSSDSLSYTLMRQQKLQWAILLQSISQTDPKRSALLRKSMAEWFIYEAQTPAFVSLEKYLPFRHDNSGWTVGRIILPWLLDLPISNTELETIREYERCIGNVVVLTNDYFSYRWEKKSQPSQNLVNAIPILMKSHHLKEELAMTLLKGIILDEEQKAKNLLTQIMNQGVAISENLRRYCYALQGEATSGTPQLVAIMISRRKKLAQRRRRARPFTYGGSPKSHFIGVPQ